MRKFVEGNAGYELGVGLQRMKAAHVRSAVMLTFLDLILRAGHFLKARRRDRALAPPLSEFVRVADTVP